MSDIILVADYEIGSFVCDIQFNVWKELKSFVEKNSGCTISLTSGEYLDAVVYISGKVEISKSKFVSGMVQTWCLLNNLPIQMNYVVLEDE